MHFKWLNLWAERTLCPDFSGREMHYWPGNLPRRRTPHRRGMAPTCTCDVIARYTRLFSSFVDTQRATPVVSSYFFPAPPSRFSGSRVVALTSSSWKGDARGRSSHVREVTVRLLFPQTAMSLPGAWGRNPKGKIRAREGTISNESLRNTERHNGLIKKSECKKRYFYVLFS